MKKVFLLMISLIISDKTYIGREVYFIDFPTELKRMSNKIVVYLSVDTHKLIGYGYVD